MRRINALLSTCSAITLILLFAIVTASSAKDMDWRIGSGKMGSFGYATASIHSKSCHQQYRWNPFFCLSYPRQHCKHEAVWKRRC